MPVQSCNLKSNRYCASPSSMPVPYAFFSALQKPYQVGLFEFIRYERDCEGGVPNQGILRPSLLRKSRSSND